MITLLGDRADFDMAIALHQQWICVCIDLRKIFSRIKLEAEERKWISGRSFDAQAEFYKLIEDLFFIYLYPSAC